MALQPFARRRVLVRAVVVEHEVQLVPPQRGAVDLGEERDDLGVGVAQLTRPDDRPIEDIARREEGRRAVSDVVASPRLGTAQLQGQRLRRAVERPDLAPLVHAEHQRLVRGRHVEADDAAQLRDEVRIPAELERLDAVRLEPVGLPDPHDRRVAHPLRLGHGAVATARRVLRARLERDATIATTFRARTFARGLSRGASLRAPATASLV